MAPSINIRKWMLWTVATGCGFFAFFICWEIYQTDQDMKGDLLLKAQLLASGIDREQIESLAGAHGDLANPNYQRLKEQLIQMQATFPVTRFVYLLGKTSEGLIFVFLDSEAPDSVDYSPPGQIYDEIAPSLKRIFETKVGIVDGPFRDRWGTWVSACVPLVNPATGSVTAIFGLDIAADAWGADVLMRSLPMNRKQGIAVERGSWLSEVALRSLWPIAFAGMLLSVLLGGVYLLLRNADRRLRDHQIKLRVSDLAIKSASQGVLMVGADGEIISANAAYEKISGYQEEELVGKKAAFYLSGPKSKESVVQAVCEAFATGIEFSGEIQNFRKDGTLFWNDISISPLLDETGHLSHFISMIRDITSRKQSEEVHSFLSQTGNLESDGPFLNALVRFLAKSLNMDFVSIAHLETQGLQARTLAIWSEGAFQENRTYFLKNTPCAHIMDSEICCFPEGVRKRFPQVATLQELQAESYLGLILRDRKDQPLGLITLIGKNPLANRSHAESSLRLVAMRAAREIGHLDAEAALQREQQFAKSIIESMPGIFYLYTYPELRLQLWNKEHETLFGYEASEMAGKHITEWLQPEDLPLGLAAVERVMEQGSDSLESFLRTKDERLLPYQCSAISFESQGQRYLMGSGVDITHRKLIESSLLQKNHELERFTYTVSHDLKSPLVTILTFLNYLKKDIQDQNVESMAKSFDFIQNAAKKMSALLDGLLKLAHKGRLEIQLTEFSLQEAVELVAGQIAERGVQIVVTPTPLILYGDRMQLREVFQNLLNNAVKYMGEQVAPIVEIGGESRGNEWEIWVRDNGKGIDPRHLGKVFDLFQKFDSSATGEGVGLALVQRIIESHGGKITVESQGKNLGTTFRFTLAKMTSLQI